MILLLKRSLVEWKGVADQMQVSRRPSQVGRVRRVQGIAVGLLVIVCRDSYCQEHMSDHWVVRGPGVRLYGWGVAAI